MGFMQDSDVGTDVVLIKIASGFINLQRISHYIGFISILLLSLVLGVGFLVVLIYSTLDNFNNVSSLPMFGVAVVFFVLYYVFLFLDTAIWMLCGYELLTIDTASRMIHFHRKGLFRFHKFESSFEKCNIYHKKLNKEWIYASYGRGDVEMGFSHGLIMLDFNNKKINIGAFLNEADSLKLYSIIKKIIKQS